MVGGGEGVGRGEEEGGGGAEEEGGGGGDVGEEFHCGWMGLELELGVLSICLQM